MYTTSKECKLWATLVFKEQLELKGQSVKKMTEIQRKW
jgi:hypothetical protein